MPRAEPRGIFLQPNRVRSLGTLGAVYVSSTACVVVIGVPLCNKDA
jgi:hypothetical protein